MQPKQSLLSSFSGVTFLVIASFSSVQAAPLLIVGNDEKLLWDDQGKPIVSPAGKDSVVILDVADPENPIVYVIDLKANPPKLAGTVTVGKQPSGLSFNPAGNLALVTNRADKSISVLSVKGTDVKVIDTVDMGDIVSHVEFI